MMPTSEDLLELQNPDGGWSYRRGEGSWTEPTCYALMALAADHLGNADAVKRGARWLTTAQRPDGGWAPRVGVEESTWVTALALLVPAELLPAGDRNRASAWLLAETGGESNFFWRLRMRLLGASLGQAEKFEGWPWYPGAAAWVTPTAMSVLALEKIDRGQRDSRVRDRITQGRQFLLARRCRDGGWNHGSTQALGYDSPSYPETTGEALLALHDSDASEMADAVAVAERQLAGCKSLEGASWLTLGLLGRGGHPPRLAIAGHGGVNETALAVLARAAEEGRNLFLE